MAIHLLRPLAGCQALDAEAVKADSAAAVRYPGGRVGKLAIYLPALPGQEYLPLADITRAVVRKRTLPTVGCCGKSYQVDVVMLWHGDTHTFVQFASKAQAEECLALLCQKLPGLCTTRDQG